MIRGVIFDMDGLLLDTERIYFSCWKKSAAEFGYVLPDEYALAVRSCSKDYAAPYFKRVMGDSFDYFKVRDRRRELVAEAIQKQGATPKPGVSELLQFCQENGIRTAVATATAKDLAVERLKMAGIPMQFSMIGGGDQVQHGKPEPEIYLRAAEALQLNPRECVAMEDSPNGIYAAFSAGCRVIMVPDLTQPEQCFQPLLLGVAQTIDKAIPILEKEVCAHA